MKTITYDESAWQLVPKEPTEEMDKAARDECHRMSGVVDPVLHIWDVMLSAAPQPVAQETEYSYASKQATNCARCEEHKHTPLRIDAMGGYVCLTCIDKKLGSLLGEFGYEPVAQEEQARPDILEKLTYHKHERDDLTLDDALEYLAHGWKKIHGRTERQMVMQILSLLAGIPPVIAQEKRKPVAWYIKDNDGNVFAATPYSSEAQQWKDNGREIFPLYTSPPSSVQAYNEGVEAAAKELERIGFYYQETGEIDRFSVHAKAIRALKKTQEQQVAQTGEEKGGE